MTPEERAEGVCDYCRAICPGKNRCERYVKTLQAIKDELTEVVNRCQRENEYTLPILTPLEKEESMATESLKVTLTIDEKANYGEQQAKALQELRQLDDRLEEVKGQIKGQQKELEARVNRISETIRNGYEYREVEVEKQLDLEAGIAKFYRIDTGEIYRTRPLSKEERQGEMALEVGKEAPVVEGALKA